VTCHFGSPFSLSAFSNRISTLNRHFLHLTTFILVIYCFHTFFPAFRELIVRALIGAMARLPVGSIARSKQAILQTSACRPQLYLSVEGSRYDPDLRATLYEIELGVLSGSEVSVYRRFVRFSGLELLDRGMRKLGSNARYLMPFPPKKYFGNLSEQFVSERAMQLQAYLQALPKIPDLLWQIAFAKLFEVDLGNKRQ
jgi:hypothetical protein